MREIKFRGKYGNNPWLYGSLVTKNRNNNGIQERNSSVTILVDDGSIGQYTGMNDSNGEEIYEGDIVVVGQDTGNKYDRYIMTFNDDSHSYLAKQQGTLGSYIGPGYWNDKLMVIGNCWDNPELLGGVHDEH